MFGIPDKKLFAWLCVAFALTVVIGTVAHELGHYLAAKYYGYEATLTYAYTYYEGDITPQHSFYITLAGPLQTMFTGTAGLVLLWIYRKKFYNVQALTPGQWIMVFTALFWLRQTVNLCVWLGGYFITGSFSANPDEIRLAEYMGWPVWSLSVVTGIAGMVVFVLVVFKCIPLRYRFTFLAAAFAGGITGYVLWLKLLGKYVLPG